MTFWLVLVWLTNALVIIGVVLEEYELIEKLVKFVRERGLAALLTEVSSRGIRKSLISKVGFAILVIGLGGELVAQAVVEIESNSELAIANTSAARANERAARIEREVSWRTLTDAQVADLHAFGATHDLQVVLTTVQNDGEAQNFCAQIEEALGWMKPGFGFCLRPWVEAYGLQLAGPEPDRAKPLVEEMARIGLPITPHPEASSHGYAAEIIVGSKPAPEIKN